MTTVVEITATEARQLIDRIKVAVEGTWLLIQEAYTSRAWAALGYSTWDDCCAAEFDATRLRLPREERQEVVVSLREAGLSLRAIEAATGVSRKTIIRDTRSQVVESAPPDRRSVIGIDGRIYARSPNVAEPDPPQGESTGRQVPHALTEQAAPMTPTSAPKTIGPPIIDRRGRLMPQRAQRKAIHDGLAALSGLCAGFARLDEIDDSISAEEAEQWQLDLSASLRVLRSLNTKLKEHINANH